MREPYPNHRSRMTGRSALLALATIVATPMAMAAAPALVGGTPADGSTGVKRNTTITATFDQPLAAPLAAGALTLTCNGAAIQGSQMAEGSQLLFTPTSPIVAGARCTASIPAGSVRNAAGELNANAFTWTFRTANINRQLTVTRAGAGSGSVLGAREFPPASGRYSIDCGAKCDALVLAGNRYELVATPAVGSSFARWVGCPQPEGDRCIIPSMTRDRQVTARFQSTALPAELSFRTVQTPVNASLFAVAYGKGVLVAGGQGRGGPGQTAEDIKGYYTLMYSTDQGETWQHSAPLQPLNDSVNPRDTHLLWVNFNGSQFLAFEQNYRDPFVSADGINWTRGQRPALSSGESVANVVWCDNRYVAMVRNGTYATSADGLTWASHTGAPIVGGPVSADCLPNGDLLVTARYVQGSQPAAMWTLGANGHTWTALDSPRTLARTSTFEPTGSYKVGFESLAVSVDGRIAAIPRPDGKMFTGPAAIIGSSSDLAVWFRTDGPGMLNRVAWTGSFFEATLFDGSVSRSRNGFAWTPLQPSGVRTMDRANEGGIPFVRIGNRLIVVGAYGQVAVGTP